jgi:hypothetical protein
MRISLKQQVGGTSCRNVWESLCQWVGHGSGCGNGYGKHQKSTAVIVTPGED